MTRLEFEEAVQIAAPQDLHLEVLIRPFSDDLVATFRSVMRQDGIRRILAAQEQKRKESAIDPNAIAEVKFLDD